MAEQMLGAFETILLFSRSFWDYLFTPISALLEDVNSPILTFLLGLSEFAGLSAFFDSFTLFGFLFSLIVVAIVIAYFFIP